MTKELDEILSGGEPARETTEHTQATPAENPEATPEATQPRGEHGHFAAKTTADGAEPEREGRSGTVPQQALHASREREKAERERADRLEREMAELRGSVQTLTQQRQQPHPPSEPEKSTDLFWEDPNKFVASAISPVQQQIQQQHERTSKLLAVQTHGREVVDAAYQALGQALRTDPTAHADYQRIMAADHPYDELVAWNKRRVAQAEIGDPAAYREKLRAEIIAEMEASGAGAQPTKVATPAVMPSNLVGQRNVGARSGPAWSGPAPLNDIFDRSRKKAG